MLIFCDPHAPATADITAFHPARAVERYDGTAGDIFTQVNTGTPGRTVIAQPLTTTTAADRAAQWVLRRTGGSPARRIVDKLLGKIW
jgi:hypothetical protein